MGLDILALSNLEYIGQEETDGLRDQEGFYEVRADDFPRHEDLKNGCYRETPESQSICFHAGTYSGYNKWRDTLSRFIYHVPASTVLNAPDAYQGRPFIELIHFTDSNGFIGPTISAKLAKDFADHEQAALTYALDVLKKGRRTDFTVEAMMTSIDGTRWLNQYQRFKDAFTLGADNGMVEFC